MPRAKRQFSKPAPAVIRYFDSRLTAQESRERYRIERDAYFSSRDDTLQGWIAQRPFSRPPLWWEFEAHKGDFWGVSLIDGPPGAPAEVDNENGERELAVHFLIRADKLTPEEKALLAWSHERFACVLLKTVGILDAVPIPVWLSCESSQRVFLALLQMSAITMQAVKILDDLQFRIQMADFWKGLEAKIKRALRASRRR